MIKTGETIPEFSAEATGGKLINGETFQGKHTVLYFYPRDNTPGCIQEGKDFSKAYDQFRQLGVQILGISRDSLRTHEKFKEKQQFPFELVADPDETLCQLFGVMKVKNMYGKQVRGIERSTFVFNKEGIFVKEWRKVQVSGHVDQVLEVMQNISQ